MNVLSWVETAEVQNLGRFVVGLSKLGRLCESHRDGWHSHVVATPVASRACEAIPLCTKTISKGLWGRNSDDRSPALNVAML